MIENTGERILLEKETPLMISRHLCAYKFARGYVAGKKVLDIGCGEGYGSYYLAEEAGRVRGIDYSPDAISLAADKYRRDNLGFSVLDVKELSTITERFSVICSFQFIEHLSSAEGFLNGVSGLLDEGGLFICSTPNKIDASKGSDTPLNRFHLKEYFCAEFRELLGRHFTGVELFGLKRSLKLNFLRRLKKIGLYPAKSFYAMGNCSNFVMVREKLETALDFIAVCRK